MATVVNERAAHFSERTIPSSWINVSLHLQWMNKCSVCKECILGDLPHSASSEVCGHSYSDSNEAPLDTPSQYEPSLRIINGKDQHNAVNKIHHFRHQ